MKGLILLISTLFLFSCASENDPNKNTKKGAGIGAAVGAVAGAIVAGDNTKGAVLGGALGAAAGGAYGKKLDEQAKELEKVAETKRTDKGIITKLKGDITFDSGSAKIAGQRSREDQKDCGHSKKVSREPSHNCRPYRLHWQ